MLSLIAKDFKLMFARNGNKAANVISWIFGLLVGGLFVAVETYLFITIMKKVESYPGANNNLFTIFLFTVTVLLTIMCIFNARKLFFDEQDSLQLAHFPISPEKKIVSKLFFLIITMYVANLVFSLPLFIAYGEMFNKRLFYFYTALYYPLLVSILEIGVALIFVYPVRLLTDFLKKHLAIQFVSVVVIAFGLTFLYSRVLNVFIGLVANNDMSALFSAESMEKMTSAAHAMVPVNFLVNAFIGGKGLFSFFAISVGAFALGLVLIIYFYNRFMNNGVSVKTNARKHEIRTASVNSALIRKEFILLFRNSDNLFSFTGLLMVEPFLCYLVVKAVNTIFSSGSLAYAFIAVPNMLPLLDILILSLMTVIISGGANSYISDEGKSLRIMKIIPVDPMKQLRIKVIMPLVFSLSFMIITFLVLLIGKVISPVTFGFGLLISALLLISVSIVSLYEEMKIRRNKGRSSIVSNLYTYLFPVVFFLIGLALAYLKVNIYVIYGIGLAVIVSGYLPYVIRMKTRVNGLFIDMEVKN